MENAASDVNEPEQKRMRSHLNQQQSSSMAKNSNSVSPDNPTVDATVLQYQNQKLVQQLDVQKQELHDLEDKIKELKDKQVSFDNSLSTVDLLWNQLVDDLVLLGIRAGAGQSALQALEHAEYSRDSIPSCRAEVVFLCKLLKSDLVEKNGNEGSIEFIKDALALRRSSTLELMMLLENTLEKVKSKTDGIGQALRGNPPGEDAIIEFRKIDDLMKEEAIHLQEAIESLFVKHKEYTEKVQIYRHNESVDQAEIKRLAGDLEETLSKLEESRRKLVNLKMQDGMSPAQIPASSAANGSLYVEKPVDRNMGLRDLKDSIEDTKILASDRLSELQEAQEDNLGLLKQLQDFQNDLKDDKYVLSSRTYSLLNDQLQYWNAEVERLRAVTDSLEMDRSSIVEREHELNINTELVHSERSAIDSAESKIEDLEHQLQKYISEKNEVEVKLEEYIQDSGREDIKAEFQVMSSALSKEIGMMESQLDRWKNTGNEALSLREEAQSLRATLDRKASEQETLVEKCAEQSAEIKSLESLIEKLQNEQEELEISLDMYGQQIYDDRNVTAIRESEQRAHFQAEHLRITLNDHGLELRVKAAKDSEAACQQRLSVAEAEIAELRAQLDVYERDVLERVEALKIKDGEAEAYISEIETIGQAYEDMQTQHQHLLQQVAERDDYNIKLVSDSVKAKQAQSFLLTEKQALEKQLQQSNEALESLKLKIYRCEEQMKVHISDALKFTKEDRHLAIGLETSKKELADSDKEFKWSKSALSSSEKEYDQIHRSMAEIQKEIDSERNEKKKLKEEFLELNAEIAEMISGSGEEAMQKLQDEIKDCKAILKCGVCFDRPKEVVIVKCYHLFCNPCIQRNLEIRHRKCPACGTAFGQSDVRFVKI